MRASGICRILRGRINGIWGSVLRVRVYESKKCDININIEAKTEVTPGDTLIILDEIQEAPRA